MADQVAPAEAMAGAGSLLPPELTLLWLAQVSSTNDLALTETCPQGTVVAADSQEKGRGRLGRVWQSPPGQNLYFSLPFFPTLPPPNWGGFSLAVGAYLGQALHALLPDIGLKWPNDLYVEGKKIGGILLETRGHKLAAGIGVNVNQAVFPPALNASSLRLCTGKDWRRDELLAVLAAAAYEGLCTWNRADFTTVIGLWRPFDILLGKPVTARVNGSCRRGIARGVDGEGRLLIEDASGNLFSLHSGEATLATEQP